MPRYQVAITEIIEYLVPVEADNEEDAAEMGEEIIVEAANRDQYFVSCRSRECEGVNPDTSQKTFAARGNWGELICDYDTGEVIRYERGGDWEKLGDGYDAIIVLDVAEWRRTYPNGDLAAGHDILDFGTWESDGSYVGPETDWRQNLWQNRPDIAPVPAS